jgi:hypothetical protein
MLELLALQPGEKILDVGCGTGDDIRERVEAAQKAGVIPIVRGRGGSSSLPRLVRRGTSPCLPTTILSVDEKHDGIRLSWVLSGNRFSKT